MVTPIPSIPGDGAEIDNRGIAKMQTSNRLRLKLSELEAADAVEE